MQRDAARQGTSQNIETIIRLEEEDEKRISHADRLSETIGSFAGTIRFVLLQLAFVTAWISANGGLVAGIAAFDPYPFSLLSVVLSLEAVLLASFVLMRQNRMSLRARRRSHLDLQVNLLSEQGVTKALQMLQRISRHLGMEGASDAETEEVSQETAVANLGRDLRATPKEDDSDSP